MSGSCARARLARAQLPDITTGVITHGFPVGELAASSSPTGKPWVITCRTPDEAALRPRRRTRTGSYRFETCRMRTGSAAIHAAAVTAAAWIAALPVAMSGSCARARLARAQTPDIATG